MGDRVIVMEVVEMEPRVLKELKVLLAARQIPEQLDHKAILVTLVLKVLQVAQQTQEQLV
jgi:hypothetical protein